MVTEIAGALHRKTRDAQRRMWKQSSGGPYRDLDILADARGSRLRPVRLFRVQMLTLCTASGPIFAGVTVLSASQFSSDLLAVLVVFGACSLKILPAGRRQPSQRFLGRVDGHSE